MSAPNAVDRKGLDTAIVLSALALALVTAADAQASPPDIRTVGPIIHLEDNLDEQDQLGWCIDTLGRGFSEALQVHSCKPAGSRDLDVTFTYDAATGRIASAAYDGKCATLNEPGGETAFGLLDCQDGDPTQAFDYDQRTLALTPRGQPDRCLVAGDESRAAGPFMSRTLALESCATVAAERRRWIVRP